MTENKVLKYRTSDVPRQQGEVGRLRILKGAEVGATFVLKSSSITLGRGDEVDIMIGDLKASRTHARVDYTREGWVVSDLGSANGIFFQGEYIRKFSLTSTEHFTIGETIFEFLTSEENTHMLLAPLRSSFDVERGDVALSEQKVRVQNLKQAPKVAAAKGKPQNNMRTIVLVAVLAGVYFFMDQPAQKPQAPANAAAKKKTSDTATETEERALASYLPASVTKDVEKTADQYYWQGFREYTNGNFIRAKDDFELALQVDPAHEKARYYLASANKDNQEEIERLSASARKAKAIGKDLEAKGLCETVLRHLYNDHANPSYADCDEILKDLKVGGEQ